MISPLTRVLIRIFAKGFYRENSGLLLFSFVTLITYGFFVNVLDQNHIPAEEVVLHQLGVVLNFLTSPALMLLIFIIWFFLAVKIRNYIAAQLQIPENQFLFYSSTAVSKINQFKAWFLVLLVIFLPLIIYGIFSIAAGFLFGYFLAPLLVIAYIIVLVMVIALAITRQINTPQKNSRISFLTSISKKWAKPLFSLFLFDLLERQTITFLISKAISLGIITGGFYMFTDLGHSLQTGSILAVGAATANSILVFQTVIFENQYLSFVRNFPYTRLRRVGQAACGWLLLTLPESIWFISKFGVTGVLLIVVMLLTGMTYRTLLQGTIPEMKRFLYAVFFLFVVLFFIITAFCHG